MTDHIALDTAFTTYKDEATEASLNHLLGLVRDTVYCRTRDDDAAQDLVVYLMLNLGTIEPRTTFSRWLSGAIRHRRQDAFREMVVQRATHRPIDDRLTVTVHRPPDRIETLAARLQDRPMESALIEAVLDGKTIRQAAQELNLGETAARNRLRRLGHKLEEAGQDLC